MSEDNQDRRSALIGFSGAILAAVISGVVTFLVTSDPEYSPPTEAVSALEDWSKGTTMITQHLWAFGSEYPAKLAGQMNCSPFDLQKTVAANQSLLARIHGDLKREYETGLYPALGESDPRVVNPRVRQFFGKVPVEGDSGGPTLVADYVSEGLRWKDSFLSELHKTTVSGDVLEFLSGFTKRYVTRRQRISEACNSALASWYEKPTREWPWSK